MKITKEHILTMIALAQMGYPEKSKHFILDVHGSTVRVQEKKSGKTFFFGIFNSKKNRWILERRWFK